MATIHGKDYEDQGLDFLISEGNRIGTTGTPAPICMGGGQAIAFTASKAIKKGMCLTKIGNDWTVRPTKLNDNFIGVACNDAEVGEEVTVQVSGFCKLACRMNILEKFRKSPYIVASSNIGGTVNLSAQSTDGLASASGNKYSHNIGSLIGPVWYYETTKSIVGFDGVENVKELYVVIK